MKPKGESEKGSGCLCFHHHCHVSGPLKSVRRKKGRRVSCADEGWGQSQWPVGT